MRIFAILLTMLGLPATCVVETPPPPTGTTHTQWAVLRKCESTNNYLAVSKSGTYRGAYQMDKSFYLTHGGDRAYLPRFEQAPPAMQDAIAYRGWKKRGWQPWPYCGMVRARRS